MMSEFGVVLFHTTSAALRAEKVLQSVNLATKLIPVPREFSSDCGIAVRFAWAQREAIETTLTAKGVTFSGIHRMTSLPHTVR